MSLWRLEENKRPRLTTIQAAMNLNVALNYDGKDKAGWKMMLQACSMAHEMGLFKPQKQSPERDDIEAQRMNWARHVTAWGVFNWGV